MIVCFKSTTPENFSEHQTALKIQDIYRDIFHLVDADLSTTKISITKIKNVKKLQNWYFGNNDSFKTHEQ